MSTAFPSDGIPQKVDWDELASNCAMRKDLTWQERARVKEAILFLKDELGYVPWWGNGTVHPVASPLIMAYGCLWACDLADALRFVKSDPYYTKFKGDLKRVEFSRDKLSILEAVLMLANGGFELKLEPQLTQSKPDLRIANPETSEILYCEVSLSEYADKQKDASAISQAVYYALTEVGHFPGISGSIQRPINKNEMDLMLEKVKALARQTIEGEGFSFIDDGTVKLALSTKEKKEELIHWAKENDLPLGLVGPVFEVDEMKRLLDKAEHEKRQLPENYPNLVVILGNQVLNGLGTSKNDRDLEERAAQIRQRIGKWHHITALMIKESYLGRPYSHFVETEGWS